jgi:hypothetical protein
MSAPSSIAFEAPAESPPGRLITCCLEDLQPHPAYVRHNFTVPAFHLSQLSEAKDVALREPLTITRDHTVLDGYARWELARQQSAKALPCLEFDLTEAEALRWLIQRHRRSKGLNDYCRILLALDLEPWLKEQARSNQQLGGQQKGSSNLTDADRMDVRSKLAAAAGVSTGNLSKARHLAATSDPLLQQALRTGEVSIHRASLWLRDPPKQLDQLRLHQSKRGLSHKIDSLLQAHRRVAQSQDLDLQCVLISLSALAPERKSSILVSELEISGEVILISSELRRHLTTQRELQP